MTKRKIAIYAGVWLVIFAGLFAVAGSALADNTGTLTSQIKSSGQNNASWGNLTWTTAQSTASTYIECSLKLNFSQPS
jgi:hypothetical protein